MNTAQSRQPRNHNNDNDVSVVSDSAAATDGLIDVNEFYKDDPSLSHNALIIIVISICCFVAVSLSYL